MVWDYSAKMYRKLCDVLMTSGYKSLTYAQFLRTENIGLTDKIVVLRHDVDLNAQDAFELAKIEHEFGLVASYYFRIPRSWDAEIGRKISEMGHEVGLHYENLDKAKGDFVLTHKLFADDLTEMRNIVDVETVSMHGNPATPFDNRDMWQDVEFETFNLLGEVYLSMDFEKALYYSDTGRTWEDGKFNIKDVVPEGQKRIGDKPIARTSVNLMDVIRQEQRNLYILTHPERWPVNLSGWVYIWLHDIIINIGKVVYKAVYGLIKSRGRSDK